MRRDEFLKIWAAWKRGKLKETDVDGLKDQQRFCNAATAYVIGGGAEAEFVAYLASVHDEVLGRVSAHVQPVKDIYSLYRGLRRERAGEALTAFATGNHVVARAGRPCSYSYSKAVAEGFARRKKLSEAKMPGLVYPASVPAACVVYADHDNYDDIGGEVGEVLRQFGAEKEIVVVHKGDFVVGPTGYERID